MGTNVDFDPGSGVENHASNGVNDAFLSVFDSSGTFYFAKTWGGISSDHGSCVAVDGSGNALVSGQFQGHVDFDPGSGTDYHDAVGVYDFFLSKFEPE
jgi:hypothetical protein